jgi:radical SAM superfamily enzyme YgiQ (UPF0313 family)
MYRNGKYRIFSAGRVIEELKDVVEKYGAKEIYFDDDDFTINKKHVLDICEGIINSGLRVKWSCMGDAINLDEEIIRKMAESGCIGIKFGVESGSRVILEKVGKPVNLEKVKSVAKWCSKYNIKSHATFSIGLLGETEETIKETIGFADKLDVDTIQLSICTPFPGTSFFNEVKTKGFLRNENWQKFDGKASEVVTYPELRWDIVESMRNNGLRRWIIHKFFSPSWIFRQFRNFYRAVTGQGIKFFFAQISAVITDELRREND